MDTQQDRIDSLEKFLEWNKTLPTVYRASLLGDDKLMMPPAFHNMGVFNRWLHTSMHAFQSAWVGGLGNVTTPLPLTTASQRWWIMREAIRMTLPEGHKDAQPTRCTSFVSAKPIERPSSSSTRPKTACETKRRRWPLVDISPNSTRGFCQAA
jgi:hypothetical protein